MSLKYVLLTGLMLSLAPAIAGAQPATVRSPVQGDPGAQPVKKRPTRAATAARADKQAPGTENGNQPDRAMAGGGAR